MTQRSTSVSGESFQTHVAFRLLLFPFPSTGFHFPVCDSACVSQALCWWRGVREPPPWLMIAWSLSRHPHPYAGTCSCMLADSQPASHFKKQRYWGQLRPELASCVSETPIWISFTWGIQQRWTVKREWCHHSSWFRGKTLGKTKRLIWLFPAGIGQNLRTSDGNEETQGRSGLVRATGLGLVILLP